MTNDIKADAGIRLTNKILEAYDKIKDKRDRENAIARAFGEYAAEVGEDLDQTEHESDCA